MATAAALPGFNDLGRSVTPTFLSRNRFYSQQRFCTAAMWHGRNKRFLFLWEKKFFHMQNIFIVPAMQHGCRAKPLLSPPCPKMNKKSMWEVKKNSRFLSTRHRTCHLAAARRVKLGSLNTKSFFKEPHQKVYLNNIWQRTSHIKGPIALILGLLTLWPYSLTNPDFSDLG